MMEPPTNFEMMLGCLFLAESHSNLGSVSTKDDQDSLSLTFAVFFVIDIRNNPIYYYHFIREKLKHHPRHSTALLLPPLHHLLPYHPILLLFKHLLIFIKNYNWPQLRTNNCSQNTPIPRFTAKNFIKTRYPRAGGGMCLKVQPKIEPYCHLSLSETHLLTQAT